jgi:hypothetical protein
MAQPASRICTLANSQMLENRPHAARLASALNGIGAAGAPAEVSDAAAYLELCSGIQKITFNTFEFDRTVGFCESADDFRDEHDDLREALVHKLTMFLFCWAALESFVTAANLPPIKLLKGKAFGKIQRLGAFISSKFKGQTLEELSEVVSCLKCTIARSELSDDLTPGGALPSFVGPPAEGIHLVYQLRNAFAHGDFRVPWPAQNGRPVTSHPDVAVVGASTKVVLLTIQILALCYFDQSRRVELIEVDAEEGTELGFVFRRLHLKSFVKELNEMDESED